MPSSTLQMRARRFGLLAACVALWNSPASAQTLFTWPDTTVHISAYTTLEECKAAVARSLDYTASRHDLETGVWTDTIPLDSLEANGPKPLPDAVVETARRCGARFSNADSVSLEGFGILFPIYLQAGWDSRARTLLARRMDAIEAKDDAERAAVLDSVFDVLLEQKGRRIGGRRLAMTEELVDTQVPLISDRVKRLRIYSRLSHLATAEKNLDSATARVARIAKKMAVIVDSLTPSEVDELTSDLGAFGDGIEEGGDFVQRYYALLNLTLGRRTFLDSLRSSTAAYVKLRRGTWAQATGMLPETYKFGSPLGEKAKPIDADIWLGYDPSKGPRPTPGKISLIVFLSNQECNGIPTNPILFGGDCARHLDPLRRLEERFPELEITVVSQTRGYFLYLKEGITPQREAELTKQWLEAHGVDAPLAMISTPFWRLPDPDTRRINRRTSTFNDYNPVNSAAFLIDEDGIIVHSRQMNRSSVAEDYVEMVQILLDRLHEKSEKAQ